MDRFVDVLITNGPMGIIVAILMYLYIEERRDHKETRNTLYGLTGKYEDMVVKILEAITHLTTVVDERLKKSGE